MRKALKVATVQSARRNAFQIQWVGRYCDQIYLAPTELHEQITVTPASNRDVNLSDRYPGANSTETAHFVVETSQCR